MGCIVDCLTGGPKKEFLDGDELSLSLELLLKLLKLLEVDRRRVSARTSSRLTLSCE